MSKKVVKKGVSLSPKQVGVKLIKTNELRANPHNPRRLFDKLPLDSLEASIRKVGILVPLTVYYDDTLKHYVILDGQRRWICAQRIQLAEVPVNQVAKPTLVENIVTMFQIHKLREDWELMPSALKLELLMNELNEKRVKQVAELTGLDQATVVRCKKLLSFSKSYQDLMLNDDPQKRIKADFFIELYAVLNDRLVKTFKWFKPQRFTNCMLERYQNGHLSSVTDFRKVKQHIANAKTANKTVEFSRRLREFQDDQTVLVDHLEVTGASTAQTLVTMKKSVEKLSQTLEDLDVDSVLGEEEFWDSLEDLMKLIRKRLLRAGRRIK